VSVSVVTASVAEQIVQVLREAIRTGELTPGELYSVEQVAKDLGLTVSRTPVREALVRLAEAGMVHAEPNRGYRILKPSVHDLEELFQLRLMLEVPAAYRAAQRVDEKRLIKLQAELDAMREIAQLTDDSRTTGSSVKDRNPRLEEPDLEFVAHDTRFHELVLEAAGNERLIAVVRNLRAIITTRGAWRLSESRHGGLPEVMNEHQPVLDCLQKRDAHGAAEAMYDHLRKTGDALMNHLEGQGKEGIFDRRWFDGVAIPRQRRR
jgi:DNA-binding GntR family transcriptional regulator